MDSRDSIIARRGYRPDIAGSDLAVYHSTYTVCAQYLANRIGDRKKTVVELCCGIGVTLEALSKTFAHVIGVDSSQEVLDACRENIRAAGATGNVELVLGDITRDTVLREIKADVALYDVPVWFPYLERGQGDLTASNPDLKQTVSRIGKQITPSIVVYSSPCSEYSVIEELLGSCEFQKVFINGKHDRNFIYLGNVMLQEGISEVRLSTK